MPVIADKLLIRVAVNGQKRDGLSTSLGNLPEALGDVSVSANWNWRDTSAIPAQHIGPGGKIPAYGLLTVGTARSR